MTQSLTRADFSSDQTVRWCPGCGDYAILKAVQTIMPELGIARENIAFISGIGCAGRFPYYMNTFGFHTIHGRAPAVATGLKLTRPELSVWMITGDGDALSIGGNHFMHVIRRDIDINILLFNNQIYGLTKGQFSPTSKKGTVTKTSPDGSVDQPLEPLMIALAAGATFVARCLDVDAVNLQETLKKAAAHPGTSVVEIYQNCHIFNDGAFEKLADKKTRAIHSLFLSEGQKMLYGPNLEFGLKRAGAGFIECDASDPDVCIHQPGVLDLPSAMSLAARSANTSPVAMGVIYEQPKTHPAPRAIDPQASLELLLAGPQSWTLRDE